MCSELLPKKCLAFAIIAILLDIFVLIFCMWDFQQILLFNVTPRKLVPQTLSLLTPPILILTSLSIFLLPNMMKLVLLKFNDNLSISNQHFILMYSDVIVYKSCCRFSPTPRMLVSSANSINLSICKVLHKPLI